MEETDLRDTTADGIVTLPRLKNQVINAEDFYDDPLENTGETIFSWSCTGDCPRLKNGETGLLTLKGRPKA